jgi:hypothetical protein
LSGRRNNYKLIKNTRTDVRSLIFVISINSLNADLNPIYDLLALLGAHHILHVSRMRVKKLTFICFSSRGRAIISPATYLSSPEFNFSVLRLADLSFRIPTQFLQLSTMRVPQAGSWPFPSPSFCKSLFINTPTAVGYVVQDTRCASEHAIKKIKFEYFHVNPYLAVFSQWPHFIFLQQNTLNNALKYSFPNFIVNIFIVSLSIVQN